MERMPNPTNATTRITNASTECADTARQERDALVADLEQWLRATATPDTDTGDAETDPAMDTLDWADR